MDEDFSLTNFEIIDCAKLNGLPLNGVFMKGELNRIKPAKSGAYVINIGVDSGSHWVALYIDQNYKICCYYDSYGCIMPVEVLQFCKRLKGYMIIYSTNQIQDYTATTCGYYCLCFIHWMFKHTGRPSYKVNKFNAMFDDNDTKLNDNILRKYFATNFKI